MIHEFPHKVTSEPLISCGVGLEIDFFSSVSLEVVTWIFNRRARRPIVSTAAMVENKNKVLINRRRIALGREGGGTPFEPRSLELGIYKGVRVIVTEALIKLQWNLQRNPLDGG